MELYIFYKSRCSLYYTMLSIRKIYIYFLGFFCLLSFSCSCNDFWRFDCNLIEHWHRLIPRLATHVLAVLRCTLDMVNACAVTAPAPAPGAARWPRRRLMHVNKSYSMGNTAMRVGLVTLGRLLSLYHCRVS